MGKAVPDTLAAATEAAQQAVDRLKEAALMRYPEPVSAAVYNSQIIVQADANGGFSWYLRGATTEQQVRDYIRDAACGGPAGRPVLSGGRSTMSPADGEPRGKGWW